MRKQKNIRTGHTFSLLFLAILTAALACPAAASGNDEESSRVLVLRQPGRTVTSEGSEVEENEPPAIGIPNPWSETEDLEEACEGSGIRFSPPVEQAVPDGLELLPYRYMDDMLEVTYANEDGTDELTIRVSAEHENIDLTGDYSQYSKSWDENFKGLIAHCAGDGETINTALFDGPDVHFAVMCNTGEEGRGITPDQLKSLVMGMQASRLEK